MDAAAFATAAGAGTDFAGSAAAVFDVTAAGTGTAAGVFDAGTGAALFAAGATGTPGFAFATGAEVFAGGTTAPGFFTAAVVVGAGFTVLAARCAHTYAPAATTSATNAIIRILCRFIERLRSGSSPRPLHRNPHSTAWLRLTPLARAGYLLTAGAAPHSPITFSASRLQGGNGRLRGLAAYFVQAEKL
ncbi:MAG TPA: hypothetical protein VG106_11010 [Vicinamibacterales bacterium]|nr:hypothetical protein [Vicinamibacterales bacterium]